MQMKRVVFVLAVKHLSIVNNKIVGELWNWMEQICCFSGNGVLGWVGKKNNFQYISKWLFATIPLWGWV